MSDQLHEVYVMTMTPPDEPGTEDEERDENETDAPPDEDESFNIPNEDTALRREGDAGLSGDPGSPPPASPGVS